MDVFLGHCELDGTVSGLIHLPGGSYKDRMSSVSSIRINVKFG